MRVRYRLFSPTGLVPLEGRRVLLRMTEVNTFVNNCYHPAFPMRSLGFTRVVVAFL
jgi:hypothetical protein